MFSKLKSWGFGIAIVLVTISVWFSGENANSQTNSNGLETVKHLLTANEV
jgi:hypothetical protein